MEQRQIAMREIVGEREDIVCRAGAAGQHFKGAYDVGITMYGIIATSERGN